MVTKREQEYLDEVCSHVKWKQAHGAIRAELAAHMEDIREALKKEGISEDEASRRAAEEMGSSELVGRQMNRAYRPQIPKMALWMLGLLVAAGAAVRMGMGESDLCSVLAMLIGLGVFFAEIRFFKPDRIFDYGGKISLGYLGIVWLMMLLNLSSAYLLPESAAAGYLHSAMICAAMLQPIVLTLLLEKLRNRGIWGVLCAGEFCVATLLPVVTMPHLAMTGLIALVDLGIVISAVARGMLGKRKFAMMGILTGGALMLCAMTLLLIGNYRLGRLTGMEESYNMTFARELLQYCKFFGAAVFPEDTAFWAGVGSGEYLLVNLAAKWGTWVFPAVGTLFAALFTVLIRWSLRRSEKIKMFSMAVVGVMMVQVVLFFLINLCVIDALDLYLPFISSGNVLQITNFFLMGMLYAAAGNAWLESSRNLEQTT